MPRKARKSGGAKKRVVKHKRSMRGANGFTDFFTKTIPGAAQKVGRFIKDQHVLSSLAGLAGSIIPHPLAKVGSAVGAAALRHAGLGRKKRGGSLASVAAQMKKEKWASRGLKLINHPDAQKAATVAHVMGYGKSKKVTRLVGFGQRGGLGALQGRLYLN